MELVSPETREERKRIYLLNRREPVECLGCKHPVRAENREYGVCDPCFSRGVRNPEKEVCKRPGEHDLTETGYTIKMNCFECSTSVKKTSKRYFLLPGFQSARGGVAMRIVAKESGISRHVLEWIGRGHAASEENVAILAHALGVTEGELKGVS